MSRRAGVWPDICTRRAQRCQQTAIGDGRYHHVLSLRDTDNGGSFPGAGSERRACAGWRCGTLALAGRAPRENVGRTSSPAPAIKTFALARISENT